MMAEFDRYSVEHKKRCPARERSTARTRGLWVCDGSITWFGNDPSFDYGPNREFVGRTCREVWEEERAAEPEPVAAPEAAPPDAPAEQVVDVKAWSISFTEGAKSATPLNPLTPSEKWAKTHSVLSPVHPEYADDAALGRLVRTLVEQGRAVWFQGDGLKGSILVSPTGSARPSNHGGSILTALVVSAGRAVLAEGGAK